MEFTQTVCQTLVVKNIQRCQCYAILLSMFVDNNANVMATFRLLTILQICAISGQFFYAAEPWDTKLVPYSNNVPSDSANSTHFICAAATSGALRPFIISFHVCYFFYWVCSLVFTLNCFHLLPII